MNCLADGVLRERNDGELSEPEAAGVDRHLRGCPGCQRRLEAIAARAQGVSRLVDTLAPSGEQAAIDPGIAYARFRARLRDEDASRPSFVHRMAQAWRRPMWAVVGAGGLVLLFGFTPARMVAQRFLDMFRVQKIAVIPVNDDLLKNDAGNNQVAKLLGKAIADNVVVTMKPGQPHPVADAAAAGHMAGFTVRSLDSAGPLQKILVTDEFAFQMMLNRERMQDLLQQAGRSDVTIPDLPDGAMIAVHTPKSVISKYGDCPAAGGKTAAQQTQGTAADCIVFIQTPSPTVSVPPNLNIEALAEAGLQVAGLTAAEAHSFCQTVDWTSTMVIPIPQNGSTYRTVSVDGVTGTLIELLPRRNSAGAFSLVWVKEGTVYSLNGQGSGNRAVAVVQSLN